MRDLKCLLVQKTWQFLACLSLFLCFAQGASASEFQWSYSNGFPPFFSSPASACEAYVSSQPPSSESKYTGVSPYQTTQWICKYNYKVRDGYYSDTTKAIYRSGNECASGSVYDSTTGVCKGPEPDKCKDSTGTIDHEHQVGTLNGSTPRSEPPGSICTNSCQYTFDYQPLGCYRFAGGKQGDPNGAFCKYKYKGNGTSCTNGPTTPPGSLFDQPPVKPPIDPEPTLKQETSCTDWVTSGAVKSRTCNGLTEFTQPGSIVCPPGSLTCTPGTPKPDYKKEDVKTDTSDTTNPDGSKKTDTVKTTTTTICSGVGSCSTTSKTETTSQGKNPDGTDGATTSECKGEKCKPGSDKPGKDEEEEEEEKSTVSGDGACPAAPACTGDAIQCAILRQTHQQRCNDEEFRKVDPQKITELKNTLDSEFSGIDYQPITATADSTYSLSNVLDTSSRFSSACPAFPVLSYQWIGGATSQLDLNSPGLCTFLTFMGFLNVAFAMRAAAGIVAGGLV